MNTRQQLYQLQYILEAHCWEGTATKVFPRQSVIITQAPPRQAISFVDMPAAFLGIGSAIPDPTHDELPDMLIEDIVVGLAVAVPGDQWGTAALMGRNRQGSSNSAGAGLLQLEYELFRAVKLLNAVDGVNVQIRGKGMAKPDIDTDHRYIIYRGYKLESRVTASQAYGEASHFAATEAGGTVTLTWTLPPDRYDRKAMVLRYASGSTAPADKDAGTGITVDPVLGTTEDVVLAAGTWSFRLIAAYDTDSNGTADAWSTGVTTSITFA